jgi:hypothetical protein
MSFFSRKKFSPSNSAPANALTSRSTQQLPPQRPPFSPDSPSPSPQQQQQPPPAPWSACCLNLLPPTYLSKNAPPSGPSRPSPSPFPRYGHALSATANAAGELFLFGGLVKDSLCNDLYVFSTRDLSTTLSQTSGEVPSPRYRSAGVCIGTDLLIWGGATSIDQGILEEPYDDLLYLLNLGTLDLLMSRPTLAD